MKPVSTALLAAALLLPAMAGAQPCPLPFIQPSGVLDRPSASFPGIDHRFVHSSTHLQGNPQTVKWAGGLIYHPPAGSGFSQFTSAVVVNNPHPSQDLKIKIEYFDHDGGPPVATSLPPLIHPEEFYVEAATPLASAFGVGSARVTALEGGPLVGAVLFHAPCMTNGIHGEICDGDGQPPRVGGSSMQQLQMNQGATELWWGPLPLTLTSGVDFFNAEAPFFFVVNPNDVPNRIRVRLVAYNHVTGNSTPLNWRTVTLPPFGTLLEKSGPHLAGPPTAGLWDQFYNWYSSLPQPYDIDVLVHVVSEDGLPILGDGVMTDLYGDQAGMQQPGVRFRMASHMLASQPASRLIDPDFSHEPGGVIQTLIGLWNAGTASTGPILVQYFNRNGGLVSTGTIPSLAPNQSARIEPGVFGYPATAVGFGWVRINGCPGDRLVGWTTREILPTGLRQFHKAFGEILDGNGGQEPGPGFQVTNDFGTWTRKVSPILRSVTLPDDWPGYTTFVNTGTPNLGSYQLLFFDQGGFNCTDLSAGSGQPFAGVPYARTSTTYEDPQNICLPAVNQSGRVDVTHPGFKGINVIGDPFKQWGICHFAGYEDCTGPGS